MKCLTPGRLFVHVVIFDGRKRKKYYLSRKDTKLHKKGNVILTHSPALQRTLLM